MWALQNIGVLCEVSSTIIIYVMRVVVFNVDEIYKRNIGGRIHEMSNIY